MNPLIRKELRVIAPASIVTLGLAILPPWIFGIVVNVVTRHGPNFRGGDAIALFSLPVILGALLLALMPFGEEFSNRTFGMLLAQPVDRSRIWRVKTSLLAAAMLVSFVACYVSLRLLRWQGPVSVL